MPLSMTRKGCGIVLGAVLALSLTPLATREAEAASDVCFTVPQPVMSLGFGSRYEAASKARTDLDEESDAAVTKALKPIDKFIQNLSREVTRASAKDDPAIKRAHQRCVIDAVHKWASADALNDMRTFNAKLAVPSRIGGIAIAYAEVRNTVPGLEIKQKVIENWLSRRAKETVYFFDNEATEGASRNNLRAWASLAVGEVGNLTKNREFVEWAILSNRTMIEGASANGSLPLEMNRKQYALHYQLHAMSPLMTSVARLCDQGYGKGGADFDKLATMARFSVRAVKDPTIVQKINGRSQTVKPGIKENLSALAWMEPYVALTGDEMFERQFAAYRDLSNSKLGGNLTDLYANRQVSCTISASN